MKRKFALPFLFFVFLFSCSTDKDDDNNNDEDSIVGTWYATELKLDSSAGTDIELVKDMLDILTSNDCQIIKFTFNSDMTAIARNSVNYLDISFGSSGLIIPCPTEEDTDEGTYTYENNMLTIVGDGQTITADVVVEGDMMTLDASDLDIPDLSYGGTSVKLEGQLVFERQ